MVAVRQVKNRAVDRLTRAPRFSRPVEGVACRPDVFSMTSDDPLEQGDDVGLDRHPSVCTSADGKPSNSSCNVEEAPEAATIIFHHGRRPSQARPQQHSATHVEAIGNHGRVSRQRSSNDNRPSLVEIMMYRYKVIGWRLHARLPHQRSEAKIGCSVVNRMTERGMPISVRICWYAKP